MYNFYSKTLIIFIDIDINKNKYIQQPILVSFGGSNGAILSFRIISDSKIKKKTVEIEKKTTWKPEEF